MAHWPVTAVLGPRQVGKTTLVQELVEEPSNYFAGDNVIDQARLANDPIGVLSALRGTVVIDEMQAMPDLYSVLRVVVDSDETARRFLITGSSSPDLIRGANETLAGRMKRLSMSGFVLSEVGAVHRDQLWMRGGFPRSFLADSDKQSDEQRSEFVDTFLTRDVPRLIDSRLQPLEVYRLLELLAHNHGQSANWSGMGNLLGLSDKTVRNYVDLFTDAYILRQLPPLQIQTNKRLRKSPKIYFRDSGLLHSVLRVSTLDRLRAHPILGFSWEGFALEQLIHSLELRNKEVSYWGTQGAAEVDCVVEREGRRFGFEFKHSSSPKPTKSMHTAIQDLELEKIYVVFPGENRFPMGSVIEGLGIDLLAEVPDDLFGG